MSMTSAHGGAGVLPVGGQRYAGVPGAHNVVSRGPPRDLPGGAHLGSQTPLSSPIAVQHLAVGSPVLRIRRRGEEPQTQRKAMC